MKPWQHLKTITHHRWLVRLGCFRVGLYRQGIAHDLSKYSPTEFWIGARYYQGNRSPNAAEREDKGYSEAWMHHKGRNRHHYEYWTDMNPQTRRYEPIPMPRKYLVEMVMDRRAACMTYQGKAYRDDAALKYFTKGRERTLMHPETGVHSDYAGKPGGRNHIPISERQRARREALSLGAGRRTWRKLRSLFPPTFTTAPS